MKTIVERIQAKANVIAKRYTDDIASVLVFADTDGESDTHGFILVEFAEYGGPKMKNGKIVGDYDHQYAMLDMLSYVKTLGATLIFYGEGDDIEHHKNYTYRVCWE